MQTGALGSSLSLRSVFYETLKKEGVRVSTVIES